MPQLWWWLWRKKSPKSLHNSRHSLSLSLASNDELYERERLGLVISPSGWAKCSSLRFFFHLDRLKMQNGQGLDDTQLPKIMFRVYSIVRFEARPHAHFSVSVNLLFSFWHKKKKTWCNVFTSSPDTQTVANERKTLVIYTHREWPSL